MIANSFGARSDLDAGGRTVEVFRLDALGGSVEGLPFSLKVLLENLLRHEDGAAVRADDVQGLAGWTGEPVDREIAFMPARILMQDFTGVPAVVDLAAMRDGIEALGGDPAKVNPLIPTELVIDHSVTVESFGRPDSFAINARIELERNIERYQFLRWGQQAFRDFRVVPPDTGICHQVNLEYLARVVFVDEASGRAYPDTLVGTDSHTPMVNGLGVLGWGVGGIEAEAAMLGQPISMLVPSVVGFRLTGELPEGSTATDLVLTVTELLRRHGVVGKFVEFYGPGVANVPLENRATIGNMSPEYGSTVTIFPIDGETLRYLRFTGRPPELVDLVERYAKEQGLWFDPAAVPRFSETLELDLATVVPSLAGPSRPQDRVPLDQAKARFATALQSSLPDRAGSTGNTQAVSIRSVPPDAPPVTQDLPGGAQDEASAESFPASDPPAAAEGVTGVGQPDGSDAPAALADGAAADPSERPHADAAVTLADGTEVALDHGHVVIAAITSCTNTSNPSVMLAAGLLAKNAVERGLGRKPWVKTSLAPGSKVVVDYFEQAGLTPYLDELGFNLVGFGCTTCIGNSGPLPAEISEAVDREGLAVVSVLSGNRNFEGRINSDVRMNYLASPPLVVAYALAGTMDIDLFTEPLGHDHDGAPVHLRDIWPTAADVTAAVEQSVRSEMFATTYAEIFEGDERWKALDTPDGDRFAWDDEHSTYVHRPPFFDGMPAEPAPLRDITGARVLAVLGDSVTTDHISPAGSIRPDSPAGRWLVEHGVDPGDFNSYGARRGNHEVMLRGTFANPRLRNRLAPGTEGGFTLHLPDGEVSTIYDAAVRYAHEGVPLVVLAGKEYGSGSSRDWAAKGTHLLGVKAVLAESFERIHRSNLIGMGVLPLQLPEGQSVGSLGLTGHETFSITGLDGVATGPLPDEVTVRADDVELRAKVRIDTPKEADYYRHGGILHYVLRQLADDGV
jgi:aconitate hydratase